MQLERERRYLCPAVPAGAVVVGRIEQGYYLAARRAEIRVRSGAEHRLTVKVAAAAATRIEIDLPIPGDLARWLVDHARYRIAKTRHHVTDTTDGVTRTWDVDSYHGRHDGLVTAEIEHGPAERITAPTWVGADVTDQFRYTNRGLARR